MFHWGNVGSSNKTASDISGSNINHCPCKEEFKSNNKDEEDVSPESSKDVVFTFFNNSAIELIE